LENQTRRIGYWFDFIFKNSESVTLPRFPIVVVGCKSDLEKERKVDQHEAKEFVEKLIFNPNFDCKIPYFMEFSSKLGGEVDCFENVVRMVLQKRMLEEIKLKPKSKNRFSFLKSISDDGDAEISEMKKYVENEEE
jgi:GTPase SAR1 family protein